ncbi:hypothetical protein A3709_02340 [Halioglobus sp. HI00S01]|uniref:sterol desaturase family protein n=1 Tax=Halioglobus sp. HI00S01 TaxID=1822214 RepID=UPI0007C22D02|nr:hypothetical protein [Halioglobus sp. HI00S01]KZX58322.1 hypothetical protein A3709_02340 [Halioglobus sp. HI00S01]
MSFAQISGIVLAASITISVAEMLYLTVVSNQESFVHAYAAPLKNVVFVGIPVEVIIVISLIDGVWGKFLHISPKLVPGRYGPLEYVVPTPSCHRFHHG